MCQGHWPLLSAHRVQTGLIWCPFTLKFRLLSLPHCSTAPCLWLMCCYQFGSADPEQGESRCWLQWALLACLSLLFRPDIIFQACYGSQQSPGSTQLSRDKGSDTSSSPASFSHSNWSQPQCGEAQASPMGTPSLGWSLDAKALLYLCLRTEHSKKQLLGHCSDPLKLMGLNHPGVSHQLQKIYTRDESGAIIFLLCAFQKDDLFSRLLCSASLSN